MNKDPIHHFVDESIFPTRTATDKHGDLTLTKTCLCKFDASGSHDHTITKTQDGNVRVKSGPLSLLLALCLNCSFMLEH